MNAYGIDSEKRKHKPDRVRMSLPLALGHVSIVPGPKQLTAGDVFDMCALFI